MRQKGGKQLTAFAVYAFQFNKPEDEIEQLPAAFLFVPMPGRDVRRGIYGINFMAITDPKLRVKIVNEYLKTSGIEDEKVRNIEMLRLFGKVYRTRSGYTSAYKYIPWARLKDGLFVELDPARLREITREP